MKEQNSEPHPFIQYLFSLKETEKRGALACLRRGLGQPPGSVVEMFRYVTPWLPEKASRNQEAAMYLVASLFASHPETTGEGNMGAHLARTRSKGGEEALERRFVALLSAHVDDLPVYLRQAVSFLRSNDEPVNWNQLYRDLQRWDHPDRYIQKEWAWSFWGAHSAQEVEQPNQ